MDASEESEVTRSTLLGLLLVTISWVLILLHSAIAQLALMGIFPTTSIEYISWFYAPLIGFLGGSAIVTMFLGKRKFLVQLVFTMAFSIALVYVASIMYFAIDYSQYASIAIDLKGWFASYKIVALEYISLPFLIIILFDLYANTRLRDMSRRKWALLICTIIVILLLLAYFSYTSIISL